MVEIIVPQTELLRRSEIRHHALVPLYVFWTPDVPKELALAGEQGVVDAVKASGQNRKIVVYGDTVYAPGPYGSSDWYVSEALRKQSLRREVGFGPQLDAVEVMKLFPNEPWQQNPHWEVFIVNNDLNGKDENGRYINFCYGMTHPSFAASVQSVKRVEAQVRNPDLQKMMIRRLLRHEVGHMFGLTERSFHVEEKLGLHCANLCTMRQGLTIQEWGALTVQEDQAGVQFCDDCLQELTTYRSRYRPLNANS